MSHLWNDFNLDYFVEICALGWCKSPNITKYATVCLSVRWARSRTTEGSPPTEPASREGIGMERAVRLPVLYTRDITEHDWWIQVFVMSCCCASVGGGEGPVFYFPTKTWLNIRTVGHVDVAIKCKMCSKDIWLYPNSLVMQQ